MFLLLGDGQRGLRGQPSCMSAAAPLRDMDALDTAGFCGGGFHPTSHRSTARNFMSCVCGRLCEGFLKLKQRR